MASLNQENERVTIPGLRGREPKEISLKNLAHIVEARMEEIIEHVYYEIKSSGFEKKLIAGIVVTGGGAQLKHVTQLIEYITGMDTRVGYPNEHLTKGVEDVTSPMYATGVGLVLRSFEQTKSKKAEPLNEGPTFLDEPDVKGENEGEIKGHSTKNIGSWFETLLRKSEAWFKEDPQ